MTDAYRSFTIMGRVYLVRYKDFIDFYPKTTPDDFARMTEGDIGALMRRAGVR